MFGVNLFVNSVGLAVFFVLRGCWFGYLFVCSFVVVVLFGLSGFVVCIGDWLVALFSLLWYFLRFLDVAVVIAGCLEI